MYVHSLVKATANKRSGWYAPIEIGESASHAVGFVIPVDETGLTQDAYTCETIKGLGSDQACTLTHFLRKAGNDSFRLSLDDQDIWFTVRLSSRKNRLLPYLGKLKHPDFTSLFVEIEPEEQAAMDRLCEGTGEFIIGCDPFRHYEGMKPSHVGTEARDHSRQTYVSLWSYADENPGTASGLLNFLCASDFKYLRIKRAEHRYLNEAFEKDERVLYRWGIGSPNVKAIAERLLVHRSKLEKFLRENGFALSKRAKPTRKQRNQWIENRWTVV